MKFAILAAAAALTMTVPAPDLGPVTDGAAAHASDGRHYNKRHRDRDRYERQRERYERQQDRYERREARDYRQDRRAYNRDRRLARNDRVWRGDDGRYRCKRDDGTVGLVIGGALGAIGGSEVAGRQNRTIGAIIGAVGGGLLGREIDRGGVKCR